MKMFNDHDHGPWHARFNHCANSLSWTARKLDPIWPGGMNYVKLNVILFCIVLPVLFAVSVGLNFLWLFGIIR